MRQQKHKYAHSLQYQLRLRVATLEEKIAQHAHRSDTLFESKLKSLNEISLDLDKASSVDELCRLGIEYGTKRLGFDRLGLWLLDEAEKRYMVGTYGVNEYGEIRDERGSRFLLHHDLSQRFDEGIHYPVLSPDIDLLNERSEVVGRGWHISVPLLDGNRFVGFMGADNLLTQKPLAPYQPELLRLYGATLGYLSVKKREQERSRQLSLEQERVKILQQFIADFAHDFKTPLTIINTRSYLISRLVADEHIHKHLDTISRQAFFINHMLDDMLMFMRLEIETQFHKAPVNIGHLLQQCVLKLDTLASQHGMTWHTDIASELFIEGDAGWLAQALHELLENAIVFSHENSEIRILCEAHEQSAQISIIDTGIGIAKEELAYIFQPFYRANKSRTTRGTGLGLSLVERILAQHSATIGVHSQLNKGTQVVLRFALIKTP